MGIKGSKGQAPNQRNEQTQPPAKRMSYSTPGTSSYYVSETKSTSTNTETTDTYRTLQSPIRDVLKVKTNHVSTPSFSPMDPSITYHDSTTSINNSVEQTWKSIFGSEDRLQESYARTASNTYNDLTHPYSKLGLLCTPFYTSRPVYVGTRNIYVNRPNIKHKIKPLVNRVDNNSSVNISSSAKRIMNLLENYPSPASEARRISRLINSSGDKTPDISLNSSVNANSYKVETKHSNKSSKGASYEKQELLVPSLALVLQLKQNARLSETTRAARQIIASHSSSINTMPYPASSSGNSQVKQQIQENLTTKMKARVTRVNRGEDKSFNSVSTASNSVAHVPNIVLSQKERAPNGRQVDIVGVESYTFSSPITIRTCVGSKPTTKEQNQNKSLSSASNPTNNNSQLKNIVNSQSNKWECPSCLVRNDNNISKCMCCETEKPGVTKESEKKSFNFGVLPNVFFKFGINPKQTNSESEPKPASIFGQSNQGMETNNNHISKTPSFTFGIQNKKPEKEISKEENKIVETPKVAFSFGIPKDTSTSNAAPGFEINTEIFKSTTQSSTAQKTIAKNSDRAQEVPSDNVTTPSVSILPSAPIFSFGTSTATAAPTNEKSRFNFTFGRDNKNETPSMFKLPFGGTPDNNTPNKFMTSVSNINSNYLLPGSNWAGNSVGNNMPLMLSGGNNNPLGGLTTGNGLPSGSLMVSLPQNQLSMESNFMSINVPTASRDMFSTSVQKENMWTPGKKPRFAFGASSRTSKPFSPVGSSPFDNSNQLRLMFGISNQPSANPFGNAAPNPIAPNMFSSPPSNSVPLVGMFGNANVPASQPPAFRFPVSSFSSFDSKNMNQQMNPNPTPAFNFGAPQQSIGVFEFGKGGAPQVQFTVGSAPNTAGRRVLKAFRRFKE